VSSFTTSMVGQSALEARYLFETPEKVVLVPGPIVELLCTPVVERTNAGNAVVLENPSRHFPLFHDWTASCTALKLPFATAKNPKTWPDPEVGSHTCSATPPDVRFKPFCAVKVVAISESRAG